MYKDAGDVLAMEAASCYGKLAVAKGVIADLHQLLAKAKLDIQHLQERLATNESVVWSQEVQPTAHLAGIHNFIALLFACMAACCCIQVHMPFSSTSLPRLWLEDCSLAVMAQVVSSMHHSHL